MATASSTTVRASNDTAANFRSWASFIHDLLVTTGGWTNTADTGQVDLTTAAAPVGANNKAGYKIYAMADSLQSTSPVYMRLDFGSSSATNYPGVWITIGTGSDGAGTITTIRYNGGAVAAPTLYSNSNTTGAQNWYGAASTAWVTVAGCGATSATVSFSLERTKDSSGADTGDGLLLIFKNSSGIGTNAQYIDLLNATQPPLESGVGLVVNNQTPFGSDVGVGVPILFKGVAQQPGLGVMVVRSADFSAGSTFTMSVYGATRTYLVTESSAMWRVTITPGGLGVYSTHSACIRYD